MNSLRNPGSATARIRQWLDDYSRFGSDNGISREEAYQVLEVVADLHAWAARAAEVADACRRLQRELRPPASASLCKQQWAELITQSGLEELTQVEIPVPTNGTASDGHSSSELARLEEHLRRATTDLYQSTEEMASLVDQLVEPTRSTKDLPLLPAHLVELPPAVVEQLTRRLELLVQGAGRVRWLYDELLRRGLRLMQHSVSSKAGE